MSHLNTIQFTLPTYKIQLLILVLLGGLMGLGQAPFHLPLISMVALSVGMFFILHSKSAKHAGYKTWSLGLGYFAFTLSWIVEPFFIDPDQFAWMAPFALIFMAAGLSLFWWLAGYTAKYITNNRTQFTLLLPFALAVAEWCRGHLLTGFPWALPAYIWVDTPILQMAALFGPYILTYFTFLIAALLTIIFTHTYRPKQHTLVILAILILLGGAWGAGMLHTSTSNQLANTSQTVRIIQPNATQNLKWNPAHSHEFYKTLLALSSINAPTRPNLIIWPETAITQSLENGAKTFQEISRYAKTNVILGILSARDDKYYNSLILLNKNGEVDARYDKTHLVPFGEYIPLKQLLSRIGFNGITNIMGQGFSAGPEGHLVYIGEQKFRPLICYEVIFPNEIKTSERPDYLVHITNDAWFGNFSGPYQHLDQARFRAVENGLPLLRSANTGISAIINAYGEIISSIPLNEVGYLDAKIPRALSPTPYVRFGDIYWFIALFIATIAFAIRFKSNSN